MSNLIVNEAEAKIVHDNEGIIYSFATKYSRYFDMDDLYQEGAIAMIKAYRNYKPNELTIFPSYAYLYIYGAMMKYMRESNTMKIAKNLAKLNRDEKLATTYLTQEFGRTPTDDEIAFALETTVEKLAEARNANMFLQSLNADDEEARKIEDMIGTTPLEYQAEYMDLKNAVNELGDIDQAIIKGRYYDGLTQDELSKQLGMSQVALSRQEKRVREMLRQRLM